MTDAERAARKIRIRALVSDTKKMLRDAAAICERSKLYNISAALKELAQRWEADVRTKR